MDTRRRLLILLLLVLLPMPARADQHNMECFAGVTPEKQESLTLRLSCGLKVVSTSIDGVTQWGVDNRGRSGTTRLSWARGMGADPDGSYGSPKVRRALFVVAESAEYVLGRDSGHSLDGWMLGLRYFMRGQSQIEPFVHIMGGRQRPAREAANTAAADDATEWSGAAALGGGVDIELNPAQRSGVVPVMRLGVDLVKSWATSGSDPYWRANVGLSFRFEGCAHK